MVVEKPITLAQSLAIELIDFCTCRGCEIYLVQKIERFESDLREQLAKEIISEGPWCNNYDHRGEGMGVNDCPCYVNSASLVRGTK